MSNRRARKKLQRAAYGPGGSLMYVPSAQQQGVLGQTFYGTRPQTPVGTTALFSPGTPLPPQPGVNPNNLPIQFKYPIAYNTYPPNRSLYEEMPSFEQLRRLAIMDYGITLCERYWLDMVPQMTLKIGLKQEYISDGAEEKDYQKEITYFKNFFSKPDGQQNIHEWIQQALVEQSQIDELYIYKHRTRGGKLLGLQIVAGDQMKPLLDDWGRMPDGKNYAYQQYPRGIPGMQYTADQIIHRRETPAVNTPYGRGRVERVLLITNTALRKQKQDLARFTDGNIPSGMMEVPESLNWTPDQIDAYEQSWNALIAGNLQQMARIKFTQPGMKYIPFVQPSFDSVIDRYWLSIRASVYGVPMDELGFTETSNRSVGEIQQDVVYRRTIGPHAKVYATTLTDIMNNDFPPEMKGDMFEVSFGGYEEETDDESKAKTITMYASAGILGLTAAAKMAGLPEDAGAPQIGRVLPQQGGPPIFLDDIAQPAMRKAQQQAMLAGFQMAANPPDPDAQNPGGDNGKSGNTPPGQKAEKLPPKDEKPEQDSKKTLARVTDVLASVEEHLRLLRADREEEYLEQRALENTEVETQRNGDTGREASDTTTRRTEASHSQYDQSGSDSAKAVHAEYRKWRIRALDDIKAGKAQRGFTTTLIPQHIHTYITGELQRCTSADDVRALFKRVQDGEAQPDSGTWQEVDKDVQAALADYHKRGVVELEWMDAPGACDECIRNAGKRVKTGQPFPTGAFTVYQHPHCICRVREIHADGSITIGYGIGKMS